MNLYETIPQRANVRIFALPHEQGKTKWHDQKRMLRHYDMPREMYERWGHRITWIISRMQYFHPREKVVMHLSFYRPDGRDLTLMYKVAGKKSMITKLQNRMNEFERTWQPTLLMSSIEQDERWQIATSKMNELTQELTQMQAESDMQKAETV